MPLKVYLDCNPRFGKAIHRVVDALREFAPPPEVVQFANHRDEADHVIHHVVGVGNFEQWPINTMVSLTSSYSVIQYCFATTENPDLVWWKSNIWDRASAVWSYYDLNGWCRRELDSAIPNFLRLPLGADPNVFYDHGAFKHPRPTLLVTSGYVAATEAVVECAEAVRWVGGNMIHLGPQLAELEPYIADKTVVCVEGISDQSLGAIYRQSSYVAALRSVEGFELPGIEGMFCGARPITYDLDCYTHWYDKAARYVRHGSEGEVLISQLQSILKEPPRPFSQVELGLAQRTFSWPRVCGKFWETLLANHGK